MKRALIFPVAAMLLMPAIAGHVSAHERDLLVKFQGGIGAHPVSGSALPLNADGTAQNVNRNIVREVPAPGTIWRIADLQADVQTDGRIKVKGRGLLIGSGDRIATNGSQKVFATLICEPKAPFVQRSTNVDGVPLDPNGDFRIDDTLDFPAADCESPVLLIRSANRASNGVISGVWFAAGIPVAGDDHQ